VSEGEQIKSYRDLRVWQLAMEAAGSALEMTEREPLASKFRLAGQFAASAASVPANISEGNQLSSLPQYLKHLYYARGSLAETRTFLELFQNRGYVNSDAADQLSEMYDGLGRMLNALISSLEKRLPT
jgi:four helix bundle protein